MKANSEKSNPNSEQPKATPEPTPPESKSTLEMRSTAEDFRIYIDGILHVRFPRDKNLKLKSWVDASSKLLNIEIWTVGHPTMLHYDNKELWIEVLKLLDEHI